MSASQRAAVVAEVRSWLGTPYHRLADIKGAGVDCAMLLVRCYVDTEVMPPFDPRPYATDWHLHRSEERYAAWAARFGTPFDPATRAPQAGDMLLAKFGRCYSHGAIMTGPTTLIHAHARDGAVVDGDLTRIPFAGRDLMFFDPWAAASMGGDA